MWAIEGVLATALLWLFLSGNLSRMLTIYLSVYAEGRQEIARNSGSSVEAFIRNREFPTAL